MRDGGKGDKPRPIPNWDHYATNWDKIFEKGKAKMKARQKEIYDDQGNLTKIEVTLENGEHLFDAYWDPNDEQTAENHIKFREWTKTMVARQKHELT